MTTNEFWARIAINAAIIIVGVILLAAGHALGGIIAIAGVAGIGWTALKAKRQIREMNAAIAAKRARQSS